MFSEVIEKLSCAEVKKILIVTHINPDGDALGSSFAMKRALEANWGEKTITLMLLKEIEKSDVLFYGEYEIYDETKDYNFDAIIALDCGDLKRLDKIGAMVSSNDLTINIDHHQDNTFFCKYNCVLPKASSTCEIICEFICEADISLNKAMATNLYIGICTDTGCFKYSNTSSKTHIAVSKLLEHDVDSSRISRLFYDTVEKDELLLHGYLVSKIEFYLDNKLAILVASKEIMDKFNITEDNVGGLVDLVRKIRGVDVAVSVKEADNRYKISLRSDNIDVSHIAHGLGGGGHIRASGASSEMEIGQIREYLIKTTEEMYR